MRVQPLSLLLLILAFQTAVAAEADVSKFHGSAGTPSASGRYRVSLTLQPGDDVAAIARQLVATYRGRLEPYAAEGFLGFVIVTTESSARLLSSDPRVASVEALSASQERLAPASPTSAIPPPREVTQAPLQAAKISTNETGSVWSIGPYSYDGSGNIKAIRRQDGSTDTYIYDAFGRLTSGTAGPSKKQAYTYDTFGNVLTIITDDNTASQTKLGVDPNTNRISRQSHLTETYNAYGTFDNTGNMTQTSSGYQFVYDAVGMVKESTVATSRKVYLYTPDDQRIATITVINDAKSSVAWTLRDTGGRVLRKYSEWPVGTWTWKEDYIYRDGQLLAAEVDTPEKTLHFFPDHLGSPRLITGNAGAEFNRRTYYPFGRLALSSLLQDYEAAGFTGHERDSDDLDYMHARYYTPTWGRFLSVDPAWESADFATPQSWNRYSYVRNNPINNTDPDGRVLVLGPQQNQKIIGYTAKAIAVVVLDAESTSASADPPPPSGNLEQRAKDIQGALKEGTQKRTTTATAIVRNADGTTQVVVASSEKNLRPAQRAAMRAGETAVSGVGHAERTIINAAAANGQTVEAVAASRPICPSCAAAIKNVGAEALSALKRILPLVF